MLSCKLSVLGRNSRGRTVVEVGTREDADLEVVVGLIDGLLLLVVLLVALEKRIVVVLVVIMRRHGCCTNALKS